MIEIIPNWHPIFVHFTVALITTSVGFYWLAYITYHLDRFPKTLTSEFVIVARWCLWIGAIVTVFTALAGFYAYYTVAHDEIAHQALYEHRNWALVTAAGILFVAGWSLWRYIKPKPKPPLIFPLTLLVVQAALLSTAWHGSEVVFRYGVGVMSLPHAAEVGHRHHHVHE